MNYSQEQNKAALRRMVEFPAVHPDVVTGPEPEKGAIATQVGNLHASLARIDTLATVQGTATAAMTLAAHDEPALKVELKGKHLRPIVTVGRGLRGQVVGISILEMHASNLRNASFVQACTTFAENAKTYESVLVEHGLRTTRFRSFRRRSRRTTRASRLVGPPQTTARGQRKG